VVVLGRRSVGEWHSSDKTAVSFLLVSSLGVVLFSFVPDLGNAAQLSSSTAWRVSAFLFASYHVVVILVGLRSRRKQLARGETPLGPKPLRVPVFAGGFSIVAAQYLTAAGFLGPWLFFFYLLGLLWLLGIATIIFAVLLSEAVSSEPAA
jgi:hypothetical protein